MKRRDLLKRTGTGLDATVGVAGVAGASRTDARHLAERVDPTHLRTALAGHDELLSELSARGLVETATLDQFEFEPAAGRSVAGDSFVEVSVDGRPARVLTAGRPVDGGYLRIGVHPGSGKAFALLERAGGGVVGFGDHDGVTTEDCQTLQCDDCDNWCCDTYWCFCCD